MDPSDKFPLSADAGSTTSFKINPTSQIMARELKLTKRTIFLLIKQTRNSMFF
jgi:hypothetical protein